MINNIADNSFLNSLSIQTQQEEEEAAEVAGGNELGQTAFLELYSLNIFCKYWKTYRCFMFSQYYYRQL
jgi:hypothetical protein